MYEMADAWGCINTYLPQHVTRNRILDFQGETWKDKRDTERPNKNYARAPGWSKNSSCQGGEGNRVGSSQAGLENILFIALLKDQAPEWRQ